MELKLLLLIGLAFSTICFIGAQDGFPGPYSYPATGSSIFGLPDHLTSTFAVGFGVGLLACNCNNQVRDQARRFCSFLFYELRIENVEACINCVVITDKHTCKHKKGCEYLSSLATEASAVCVPSGCAQLMDFTNMGDK